MPANTILITEIWFGVIDECANDAAIRRAQPVSRAAIGRRFDSVSAMLRFPIRLFTSLQRDRIASAACRHANRRRYRLQRSHRDVRRDVDPDREQHQPAREVRPKPITDAIAAEMDDRVRHARGDVKPSQHLHRDR